MPGALDSILGAVSPIVGGLLSYEGQKSANAASAASAQKQMDFQERMSSTQYQRSVADMRAAGINPMMASMSGQLDSSAGGAAYSAQNEMAGMGQVGAAVSNSALSWKQLDSQIYSQMSSGDKAEADAASASASVLLKQEEADLTHASAQGQYSENVGAEALANVIAKNPKFYGWMKIIGNALGPATSAASELVKGATKLFE